MDSPSLRSQPSISERLLAAAQSASSASERLRRQATLRSSDTGRFMRLEALLIERARQAKSDERLEERIAARVADLPPRTEALPAPVGRIIVTVGCLIATIGVTIGVTTIEHMPSDLLLLAFIFNCVLGLLMSLAPQAAIRLSRGRGRIHQAELLTARCCGIALLVANSCAMNTL